MIFFDNVSKIYDGQSHPVVDNVSFAVNKGEILTLLGSSGAGKTTLLKMVNRLCEPSQGQVIVDDHAVRTLDPIALRRQIGYVSQNSALFPHMTVEDNITLVLQLQKKNKRFRQKRADELLEFMNLDPRLYAKRFPDALSGGQQQRVSIAKALAADPQYLLLDEPFAALDPLIRGELQAELLRLNKTFHKTILFVTHDISEALRLGNTIAIMHQGKLEQIGTAAALLQSPANDFVKNFMAARHCEEYSDKAI